MRAGEVAENIATHSLSESKGSKRRRDEIQEEEEEEEEELTEDFITFQDTLIALNLMRSQFPKIEKVATKPFVLRSQLYSSVKDRTQVDRELEDLRKQEVLRIFKLNTGQDDNAIMFMDDYLQQVEAAKISVQSKHPDDVDVFDWFRSYVLASNLGVSISHSKLCELLSRGGALKDKHISLLINTGILSVDDIGGRIVKKNTNEVPSE
ncbi:uncharacterized protein LOC131072764 isoform X2 [Cryptomeria japonica]|uniref:uncharacterized protein LOC131072764 isoform X2 n=1 Tax=Cryptomeria japonica TaxID=3369 RepID=UPI0025AC896E|nr:uncharacterized protein LOC131072764 isoform X2 [Cryptomeria japonica]